MSSFVALPLHLSSPLYLDVVELLTKVIRVVTLLKVDLFICVHLEAICFTKLTMGSMWSLKEPITENSDC